MHSKEECQSKDPIKLELEVVSLKPRVFIIDNFLSAYEADHIVDTAKPQVRKSFVGNEEGGGIRESSTRTSYNTWIPRSTSAFYDSLYRRAGDLLRIDESILYNMRNAEDIQVVHYEVGQKYDSHHDWGVSGYDESRFITLLLYLTDSVSPFSGGETAFPKGYDGKGMKVYPKKGMAVLFYDLLEDGNGDDLSVHAAMPVHEGEKWLANFWVWDPKRRN
jgi:prolyl 4-hydroxylase